MHVGGFDWEDAAISICGDHGTIVVKDVVGVVLGDPVQAPTLDLGSARPFKEMV